MKVRIVNTDYSNLPPNDIAPTQVGLVGDFDTATNPLYIGVKDQQVSRMKERINREKLGGNSIGFWELLSKKGSIKWDVLKDHDVIFICSPDRCHEKFREDYSRLVDSLVNS